MNVVWVTGHHPAPREGGAAAHEFELVRAMAARHRIHVICGDPPGDRIPELEELAVGIEYVKVDPPPPPKSRAEAYWRLLTNDARTTFFSYGDTVAAFADALERHQASHPVDLVHVVMSEVAPVVEVADAPTTLLLFDVFTRHARRELAQAHTLRSRLSGLIRLSKIRSWERRWYGRADGIACVSSVDADLLSRSLSRHIEVIPNPIAEAFFQPPGVVRSRTQVVFIATLDYGPNIEAVRWLTDAVWPEVLLRRPDASLRIVGWKPSPEVSAHAESVGAELYRNVEDVRPFYWEAAVAVAPIHLGSGLRNKVLHAMACGAPLVVTPTAVEGLAFVDERSVLIRDGAKGFAAGILEALEERQASIARATKARDHVEAFRSNVIADRLDEWWTKVVAKQPINRLGGRS